MQVIKIITLIKIFTLSVGIKNPKLLPAICWVESSHSNVINEKDNGSPSYGVCQIKLKTAQWMNDYYKMGRRNLKAIDLMKPEVNILYAALYLKFQEKRYEKNEYCIVSAYNGGRCFNSNYGYVNKVRTCIKYMERFGSFRGCVLNSKGL